MIWLGSADSYKVNDRYGLPAASTLFNLVNPVNPITCISTATLCFDCAFIFFIGRRMLGAAGGSNTKIYIPTNVIKSLH